MPSFRRKLDYAAGREPSDIVICVMGPTKAGKSSFLNRLLPDDSNSFVVGKRLVSCTWGVSSRIVPEAPPGHDQLNRALHNRRIVLVDTPGFDDTYLGDDEVLMGISEWLAESCSKGMLVGGVIYIHDVTRVGTASKAFTLFSKLCGDKSMHLVGIVTTKWDRLHSQEEGAAVETELCQSPWGDALEAGARLFRLQPADFNEPLSDRHMAPWDIVHQLVLDAEEHCIRNQLLHIQDEIINKRLVLPQTDAGRELQMSLNKLLKRAKELKAQLKDGSKSGKEAELRHELESRRRDLDLFIVRLAKVDPPGIFTRAKLWFHSRS